ncbi:disulfide bond formation protein B [Thioclava nitratireducens]|uniref:Disulfide bond formation protein B n=1 Tax=Thioclava nitratireducens TaxID=1915078 RepID=A0ABN4X701_9RHOB|nr:disulfide bond formation protein B [Thioclava nitratireducens]AQS48276.1 disulfide bond formation protein B [Thioclava nitratireducens]
MQDRLQTQTSFRGLVGLAAAGSAVVLAGAFVFQALGYAPCHLCLLQRWPHLVAILIGLAILAFRLPGWTALLGMLAALTTSVLGFYHSGVERKIFQGPTDCTSNGVDTTVSAADLLKQINEAPLVRCDEIPWDIFGITMANLNAIGSLVLAGIWLWAFLKSRRA